MRGGARGAANSELTMSTWSSARAPPSIVVASPDYLSAHGTPRRPTDLHKHRCLHLGTLRASWHLHGPKGEQAEVPVDSRLRSDNGEVSLGWALAGCGLVLKSWIDVQVQLRTGQLVHVLPRRRSEDAPVCALFPSNRLVPTRLRLFLDAVTARHGALLAESQARHRRRHAPSHSRLATERR